VEEVGSELCEEAKLVAGKIVLCELGESMSTVWQKDMSSISPLAAAQSLEHESIR
jgi:hypothetical protein